MHCLEKLCYKDSLLHIFYLHEMVLECTFIFCTQIYGTAFSESGQVLYSLVDDDTLRWRLPVTQIRFKHFTDTDKVEHTHILMATCEYGIVLAHTCPHCNL